jgi:hypothetical protein
LGWNAAKHAESAQRRAKSPVTELILYSFYEIITLNSAMPVKDIEKATPEILKDAYERDYHTPAERRDHVHTQVINIVNKSETIGGIPYSVIDLTTLVAKGCKKVVDFLLESFQAAGVRPDTPFHKNEESKYIISTDMYRYVEYNVIGGGMRLIYDSKKDQLFLSCHYSTPALVIASGAGSTESASLSAILKGLKKTHKNLKNHSEGTYFGADQNNQHLEAIPRADPAFKAWLMNKNSRQAESTLQAYGLR